MGFSRYTITQTLFLIGCVCFNLSICKGQTEIFNESKIGVFFSSKQFEFSEEYYFPMTQFLKVEEDRSWTGNMKMELLIRVGELLTKQLKPLTKSDTVFFINADIDKGKKFLESYQSEKNRINPQSLSTIELDYIIVFDAFDLLTRPVRSTFIRSNRMYTEKIQVKRAYQHVSIFDTQKNQPIWTVEMCFDERESPPVKPSLDFYNEQSPLGLFLSKVFTQIWNQMENGKQSNCDS